MKSIYINFFQMFQQMKQDKMLIAISFVPFLTGLVFRFVIPLVENLLTNYFDVYEILQPYYPLFDLFLVIITPAMFNYVVAMVMLEEIDERITTYLAITPLGKTGYLFSRLGFSGMMSFVVNIAVVMIFRLAQIDMLILVCVALVGAMQGVVIALLIIAVSENKVEGMAIGKIASLFNMGAVIPYFITGNVQYLGAILPTFWIGKAMQTSNYFMLIVSFLLAAVWLVFLFKKFLLKING